MRSRCAWFGVIAVIASVPLAILAVVLLLIMPTPRALFVRWHGGECVYTGNGTAACTLASGEEKSVTIANTPTAPLGVGRRYAGAACTLPTFRYDYYGVQQYVAATGLPAWAGLQPDAYGRCAPRAGSGAWVLLWDNDAADAAPLIFSPYTDQVMLTAVPWVGAVGALGAVVWVVLMSTVLCGCARPLSSARSV